MKNVLFTGANRGLGFEIARQLGKSNFHIFLSGRDHDALLVSGNRLKEENISSEILIIDTTSDKSVKESAYRLAGRQLRLDVIINNAGILEKQDISLLDDDFTIMRETVNSNSYGPLRVIKEFIPLMNIPGRIINISSGGGSMSDPVEGWSPAYCASKTLLNAITRHLAYELRDSGISINAVCPGWLKTDMGGRSAPRSVEKGAQTPVWLATEAPQELNGLFFRDRRVIEW
jgi:NAD(P)-dependent dehydrogenase (short-subunit alcohol dehydrogenase family)